MPEKKTQISNQLEKVCSKLQICSKNIKSECDLKKSVKLRIQKLIENDNAKKLQEYLDNKRLSYDVQIGIQQRKWNIVHFAVKNNSTEILKVILAKTYQCSASKYKQLLNTQTSEGYSPLMISIINSAHKSFKLLLELGGSDIHCFDNKNMTAYDLALNYKDEVAIKDLINYEALSQRDDFVNDIILMKPIDPCIGRSANCYTRIFNYFLDCFICLKQRELNEDQLKKTYSPKQEFRQPHQSQIRSSLSNNRLLNLIIPNQPCFFDRVSIGNQQIQSKYQIEWIKISTAVNQKNVLFDCFQPNDIEEHNLIIANNLIIFQCLSNHAWLIKRNIKQIKKGQTFNRLKETNQQSNLPHQYSIELYKNGDMSKVTVDEFIPFLKQRKSPMFLSNQNEIWPQILQKGLAKCFGSYMKLSELQPITLTQTLTGSYTVSFSLEEGVNFLKNSQGNFIKKKPLIAILQDFNTKNYFVLLQGRQGTSLSPKKSPSTFRSYCYNIVNFYEKGAKRLILISCPYVLNSWKEKEKAETLQLKLIKSHYNFSNQMCVWIEQNQFAQFFKSIVVSFTQSSLVRSQIKVRYCFEIQNEKKSGNPTTVFEKISLSTKNIFSRTDQKEFQEQVSSGSKRSHSQFKKLFNAESFKVAKLVFVKFKVQNKNLQFSSFAIKDQTSHQYCKIRKFKGWIDGGSKEVVLENPNPYCQNLIKTKLVRGDYLCMFEVQFYCKLELNKQIKTTESLLSGSEKIENDGNEDQPTDARLIGNNQNIQTNRKSLQPKKYLHRHELLVICWCQESLFFHTIEEEFAVIDFLESWRQNTIKNWECLSKKTSNTSIFQSQKYVTERIGQKFILMTKSVKERSAKFKIRVKDQQKHKLHQIVYEGNLLSLREEKVYSKKKEASFVVSLNLVKDCQNNQFQYAVFNHNNEIIEQLQKNSNFVLSQAKSLRNTNLQFPLNLEMLSKDQNFSNKD